MKPFIRSKALCLTVMLLFFPSWDIPRPYPASQEQYFSGKFMAETAMPTCMAPFLWPSLKATAATTG